MYNQFFFFLFDSGTMLLIKDQIATMNPNIRRTGPIVRREPIINPNVNPRFAYPRPDSMIPVLHFKHLNPNLPVFKEDRNRCMRRNSDTTVK